LGGGGVKDKRGFSPIITPVDRSNGVYSQLLAVVTAFLVNTIVAVLAKSGLVDGSFEYQRLTLLWLPMGLALVLGYVLKALGGKEGVFSRKLEQLVVTLIVFLVSVFNFYIFIFILIIG
jgi:hypothetical protein